MNSQNEDEQTEAQLCIYCVLQKRWGTLHCKHEDTARGAGDDVAERYFISASVATALHF